MKNRYYYDLDQIAEAVNEKTKIIYLANPNNPTGTIFTAAEFESFYKKIPEHVLIILDEAYYEYASYDRTYPDSLSYRYDNIITLRTFSKAYGLAGLRIGVGIGHDRLISELQKIRLPFEPNSIAQSAALEALKDTAYLQNILLGNNKNLTRLKNLMENFFQKPSVPSHANFIMIELESEEKVDQINMSLLKKGVITRPLASFGWPKALRISVGTDEELDFLEEKFNTLTP